MFQKLANKVITSSRCKELSHYSGLSLTFWMVYGLVDKTTGEADLGKLALDSKEYFISKVLPLLAQLVVQGLILYLGKYKYSIPALVLKALPKQ